MNIVTLSNYIPVSIHGNIYNLDSVPEEIGNWEHFPLLKAAEISIYMTVLQPHRHHHHNHIRNRLTQLETTIKFSLKYQWAKSFWFSATRPSLNTQDLAFNTQELLLPFFPSYTISQNENKYKISHILVEQYPTVFYKACLKYQCHPRGRQNTWPLGS